MVSMATVDVILEHRGWHTKLVISPLLLVLGHLVWSRFKAKTMPFHPMVSNASDLICILMNFNENIKNDRKIAKSL